MSKLMLCEYGVESRGSPLNDRVTPKGALGTSGMDAFVIGVTGAEFPSTPRRKPVTALTPPPPHVATPAAAGSAGAWQV